MSRPSIDLRPPTPAWARPLLALALCAPLSCEPGKGGGASGADTAALTNADGDNDGFSGEDDCNDGDAAVSPAATELCNGIDDDCDGEVDEDVGDVSFEDADGDGFGDPATATEACTVPEGHVPNANDCDDGDPAISPGAAEVCDGVDNNCDGALDEGLLLTYYADLDGDGFGDLAAPVEACAAPDGAVSTPGDCDDADPDSHPGAAEACDEVDNDCDGDVDEGVTRTFYLDGDSDGYGQPGRTVEACALPAGYAEAPGDCDDGDDRFHPDALEDDCTDPADYNCDGSVMFADADGDGWPACEDCDDSRAAAFPGAPEVCNGLDDNCDALRDDADPLVDLSTGTAFYADADADGFGDPSTGALACAAPSGRVADNTDCNDRSAAVRPSAQEVCNLVDDDCDGSVDDADPSVDTLTGSLWYADGDGDGYGLSASFSWACAQPAGAVAASGDCDDADRAISPGATEVCNGDDDDCDGFTDDADADVQGRARWYLDGDGDGYGAAASSALACAAPTGHVANASDCDDARVAVNPAATEVCNLIDDDCDLAIDDADPGVDLSTASTWYRDADGDGYGLSSASARSCALPSGYASATGDCNDSSRSVSPGATEVCDGVDNDCDSAGDEGLSCSYKLVQSDGSSGLCVDDDVYVNLNGSRIYTDTAWGAQCGHVVSFTATPGDSLLMWAIDSVGGCRNISDVYIVNVASGARRLLAAGYGNTCGHGASSSAFWSATVAVPGVF